MKQAVLSSDGTSLHLLRSDGRLYYFDGGGQLIQTVLLPGNPFSDRFLVYPNGDLLIGLSRYTKSGTLLWTAGPAPTGYGYVSVAHSVVLNNKIVIFYTVKATASATIADLLAVTHSFETGAVESTELLLTGSPAGSTNAYIPFVFGQVTKTNDDRFAMILRLRTLTGALTNWSLWLEQAGGMVEAVLPSQTIGTLPLVAFEEGKIWLGKWQYSDTTGQLLYTMTSTEFADFPNNTGCVTSVKNSTDVLITCNVQIAAYDYRARASWSQQIGPGFSTSGNVNSLRMADGSLVLWGAQDGTIRAVRRDAWGNLGCSSCYDKSNDGCSDGSACTLERCTPTTGCSTVAAPCGGGIGCSPATCNIETGCSSVQLSQGDACSDGNACTSGETCASNNNTCTGGTALNCDDGVSCTLDWCSTTTGCVHTPSGC
jgi:hypothetical protein